MQNNTESRFMLVVSSNSLLGLLHSLFSKSQEYTGPLVTAEYCADSTQAVAKDSGVSSWSGFLLPCPFVMVNGRKEPLRNLQMPFDRLVCRLKMWELSQKWGGPLMIWWVTSASSSVCIIKDQPIGLSFVTVDDFQTDQHWLDWLGAKYRGGWIVTRVRLVMEALRLQSMAIWELIRPSLSTSIARASPSMHAQRDGIPVHAYQDKGSQWREYEE
jgi:hypothetical protein